MLCVHHCVGDYINLWTARRRKDAFSNLTFYGEIKLDLQICLLSTRAEQNDSIRPSVPDSAGRHAVVADHVAEGLVVPAEDLCHHAEEEVDDGEGRKDDVEDELRARRHQIIFSLVQSV